MTDNFIPTHDNNRDVVPYFERARADYAPYYSSSVSVNNAKAQITAELAKLDAAIIAFDEGYFEDENGRRRHGYRVRFMMQGKEGRFKVAGLPMLNQTDKRLNAVRVQALLVVRDWLKGAVLTMVFSPGNNPLVPHLIGKGNQTLAELIAQQESVDSGDLPLLVEGVLVE